MVENSSTKFKPGAR